MPLRTKANWFGVVLGATDPKALADFYVRLLDWQLYADAGDENFFSVAPDDTSGYNLACQYEEHHVRPEWPGREGGPQMQVHLDFQVDDLDDSVAHAVGCGAELHSFQPQEKVRVMVDPEGHPFCLYL